MGKVVDSSYNLLVKGSELVIRIKKKDNSRLSKPVIIEKRKEIENEER